MAKAYSSFLSAKLFIIVGRVCVRRGMGDTGKGGGVKFNIYVERIKKKLRFYKGLKNFNEYFKSEPPLKKKFCQKQKNVQPPSLYFQAQSHAIAISFPLRIDDYDLPSYRCY